MNEVQRLQMQLTEHNEFCVTCKDGTTHVTCEELSTGSQALKNLLGSWTFQHCFLVVMGGFQFRPEIVDEDIRTGKPLTVISSETFLFMLKNGYADKFPVLSAKDIADRSKAEGFAKLLSCLQVSWLMIQLLGRVIGRLTITELEVNTFAHTCCAIAMYAFWMNKPLNLQQPVYVDAEGLQSWIILYHGPNQKLPEILRQCAVTWSQSPSDLRAPVTHAHQDQYLVPDCSQCQRNLALSVKRPLYTCILADDTNFTPLQAASFLQQHNENGSGFFDFVVSKSVYIRSRPRQEKYQLWDDHPWSISYRISCELGERVYDIVEIDVSKPSTFKVLQEVWKQPGRDDMLQNYRVRGGPTQGTSMIPFDAPTTNTVKMLSMVAISSVYGGIHASLWNRHFPTKAEMWLWRASSLVVAGDGFVVALMVLIGWNWSWSWGEVFDLHNGVRMSTRMKLWYTWRAWTSSVQKITEREYGIPWYIHGVLFHCFCLIQIAFVFGRMFLIFEAFISLRSQPPSTYRTPQWTQWLPHL